MDHQMTKCYEQIERQLERVRILYDVLGHPQTFPAVHLAGTNGKGSTAAFLESMYRFGGYRTALYTSPHLTHLGERLLINGKPLEPKDWFDATQRVIEAVETHPWLREHRPTYFENLTAVAYLLISQNDPEIAIVETGMGGRLDATNLLDDCRLSIITPIDWDHMEFLGNSLEAIAQEKFGIIKKGRPALFGANHSFLLPLFEETCRNYSASAFSMVDSTITDVVPSLEGSSFTLTTPMGVHSWQTELLGTYQPQNAALALRATEILNDSFPLDVKTRYEGLKKTRWPGRLELLSRNPDLILDGAHNPHGMWGLINSLRTFYGDSPITVVFTAMADKNYGEELKGLAENLKVRLICTQIPFNGRCETAEKIRAVAREFSFIEPPVAIEDPWDAFCKAKGLKKPVVLCGSLYFIGAMRFQIVKSLHSHDKNFQ